ncbi:Uncharacterized conserved protein YecT, DUF1311 family [Azotobacter beijerinckii]|uniref:Uncharacterized conserved protein YecT, DUF1311 family n=2 Tax=Azotobacter beijerinckii TaxID=170623 RepID=A0A1I0XJT8_9GAMM|nr:Uncharacterized conserved protein YecT, DUF1311 family [Azotobacter beijerinckii]
MWRFGLPGRLTGVIAVLMLPTLTIASDTDPKGCMEAATTQLEHNQCATSYLKAVDDEMNRVYQIIISQYKADQEFIAKLRNAQRAWLAFRDAELEARFPAKDKQSSYGSVYPMCSNTFLVQRTQERIKHLREWLDGIEEGEVCAGSMHYKRMRPAQPHSF